MITHINEAFELERVSRIIDVIDKAIAAGDNKFDEAGAGPTEAVCRKLATYLMDVAESGEQPAIFGHNKYIVGMTGLQSAQYGFS